MRKRGYTLVELMVSLIIFGVLLAGAFTAFIAMWQNQGTSVGLPASQQGAEEIAYKLAESFRGAAVCQSTDSGCVVGSSIQNASSTGCAIYSRNSSGTLVQTTFSTVSGSFEMTTGSTSMVLATNATVTLTYYTSSAYNATALTTFTPSSTTEQNLIAVQIAVNVQQSGGNNTYTTFVRLENGP